MLSPTIEAVNRLSPAPRPAHGSAFAVVNVPMSVCGSIDGPFQIVAPPTCHSLFAGHVPEPISPGVGTVKNRHTRWPVFALYAVIEPRAPYSEPETPTMTSPL